MDALWLFHSTWMLKGAFERDLLDLATWYFEPHATSIERPGGIVSRG